MRNTLDRIRRHLPRPSHRFQVVTAWLAMASQILICTTGSVVRVTSSGLGCSTWPQCTPGQLTPTRGSGIPLFHQFIEFGNRTLTFVVCFFAGALVIACWLGRRRRSTMIYAWLMPLMTVVQAVVGGLTVLAGLLWWTVAVHLLVSMIVIWIGSQVYMKVRYPDDGAPVLAVPNPLRYLAILSAVAMGMTLITGTMVTGAGPHAGDKDVDHPVVRLHMDIENLVHVHAEFLVAYLALLVGLAFALWALGTSRPVKKQLAIVIGVVVCQAMIGLVQFWTHVPAVLVVFHVTGAAVCVAATGILYAKLQPRIIQAGSGTDSDINSSSMQSAT